VVKTTRKYQILILTILFSVFICGFKTFEYGRLFVKDEGYYNYCPSAICQDGINVFYCANDEYENVKDCIYLTKSTSNMYHGYDYNERQLILEPSVDGWDSVHCCDPSILKYETIYNGETYNYILAYLGCNTTTNEQNKIGLAVAKDIDGDYVKIDTNPIIQTKFYNNKDIFEWGVGQPSLLKTDEGVLIFYTHGSIDGTYEYVELWDLHDLNEPVKLDGFTLSSKGVNDFISNADFAFLNDTIYMICDKHPYTGNVPKTSVIFKTSYDSYLDLKKCKWEKVKVINKANQNHNCSFVRDINNYLYHDMFLYTDSIGSKDWKENLFSYSIKYDYIE